MAATDERVRVADSVYLHVRRWPGDKRPFLLVHGLSSNARLWDQVARDLSAAGYPVHAVDLRPPGTLSRRRSVARHMRIVRCMWDDPPHRYYPSVSVPVLLIPALPADHPESRRARVEAAGAALPDATIREYLGADHDLHAQYP